MVDVERALFHRHLGLPEGVQPDEATVALAEGARRWYREQGDPWTQVCSRPIERIAGDEVWLAGGGKFRSGLLAGGFQESEAHAVVIVAVSAGMRVDREIDERWGDGRPDEAMVLNAYAVAVAEQLRAQEGDRLRTHFARSGMAVLPHYSPGYEGWGLEDQAALFWLLDDRGPLELLPSGGLRPARSALAAFGVTRRTDLADRLKGLWFHRAANGRAAAAPRCYGFPERALGKWSRERLAVRIGAGGAIQARFRFDGTTCSSLGLKLAFEYDVELSGDGQGGYRIAACSCQPAVGDTGHRSMCAFLADPERLMSSLNGEHPLLGMSLEAALEWNPESSPSGCLCLRGNRAHKWRLVVQTLHYRLMRPET